MNCIGISGDPVDGVDFKERGLWPVGVRRESVGMKGIIGSGVAGDNGGVSPFSGASSNVAELIHFSSRVRECGGESGKKRRASAKWSLMNLWLQSTPRASQNELELLTLIVLSIHHPHGP
jgi:hypothetical protein